MSAQRLVELLRFKAYPGTIRDDQMRERQQQFPAMPSRKPLEGIRAKQQGERTRPVFGVQRLQCRYRIARPGAVKLSCVGDEPGEFRASELDHGKARLGWRKWRSSMRRIARRNEKHVSKTERCPDVRGQAQMSVVNRIECAAENADRAHCRYRV